MKTDILTTIDKMRTGQAVMYGEAFDNWDAGFTTDDLKELADEVRRMREKLTKAEADLKLAVDELKLYGDPANWDGERFILDTGGEEPQWAAYTIAQAAIDHIEKETT